MIFDHDHSFLFYSFCSILKKSNLIFSTKKFLINTWKLLFQKKHPRIPFSKKKNTYKNKICKKWFEGFSSFFCKKSISLEIIHLKNRACLRIEVFSFSRKQDRIVWIWSWRLFLNLHLFFRCCSSVLLRFAMIIFGQVSQ